MLTCYHFGANEFVIELREIIDLGNELSVEDELHGLVRDCGARTVSIDIHTAVVTAAAIRVLVRVRSAAGTSGVALRVVAREPLARRIFRVTGLQDDLGVAATLS